ncbi:hypothetical protein SDC9_93648 [bioreactor metagenome]|uniref:Uncharacterized protein n=1 Tax=bioreactor metagenome TaxID=1076179 RepID=A0A645A3V1_9ZZZZ
MTISSNTRGNHHAHMIKTFTITCLLGLAACSDKFVETNEKILAIDAFYTFDNRWSDLPLTS